MEDEEVMEELVRRIEDYRLKPGISRADIFSEIREYFGDDDTCETFITTAVTQIRAEEQIREFLEFKKDGIELDLYWNTNVDASVCDRCRQHHGKPGPWHDSPPPLHSGCRCWLTMKIKR